MPTRPSTPWPRWPALLAAVTVASTPGAASAQLAEQMEPDPTQPVKEGFDTHRAIFFETSNFTPLRDPEWRPLDEVLRAGDLTGEAPVLVFEAGGTTLVLVSSQMSYHHVAQGEMNGEPWMVTF